MSLGGQGISSKLVYTIIDDAKVNVDYAKLRKYNVAAVTCRVKRRVDPQT